MVFSDRGMLAASARLSVGLELELRVDADRLVRAGVAFNPKTSRAFALVPAADGAWTRVELEFVLVTDDGERSVVSFSGSCEAGLSSRDGVAFGLDVPGVETTRVWAQRPGDNVRPVAGAAAAA
jgi:hypothetical protein